MRAKIKHYVFRKFLIIKISSTISGLSDCLLFFQNATKWTKRRSEVAELAGTLSKDFVSKENWGNIKECLFHHYNHASPFENKIVVLISRSTSSKSSSSHEGTFPTVNFDNFQWTLVLLNESALESNKNYFIPLVLCRVIFSVKGVFWDQVFPRRRNTCSNGRLWSP